MIWKDFFTPHLNTQDRWWEGKSNTQGEKKRKQVGERDKRIQNYRKIKRKQVKADTTEKMRYRTEQATLKESQ